MNKEMTTDSKNYEEFEKSPRSLREEDVLHLWQQHDVFQKTLEKDAPAGEFVFFEGPPTANGRPGIHHLEARSFKDIIPRYKTMKGFHVRRKGGWDTHGLPVELQVEKELGLTSKKEVEEYGVAAFNEKCRESVWKYVDEWEAFTRRSAYWVDLENPYVTYHPSYIESVWNVVSKIYNDGRIYKDYKVLPWCPRCGTALSSHELAQGYADIKDLSVTAKFELTDAPGTYLLAWTTTPWTLPGNVGLAVGKNIEYVKVSFEDGVYICAGELVETVFSDKEYQVGDTILGSELIGKSYKPVFPYFEHIAQKINLENLDNAYKVYAADFVTTQDGTGIVHTAVMYGQDDFELGTQVGLPKLHMVNEDGTFVSGTGVFEGLFVKDTDTDVLVIKELAAANLLFSKYKYEHNYPHCWRCKTPLIYYARDSWYIRMHDLSEKMLENNEKINWEPAHIKEGRFGEWLRGIRDWAISRERYWGTPLPIWESKDGETMVVGSYDELKSLVKNSGNTFYAIRHGEAQSNVGGVVNSDVSKNDSLTEKGQQQIKDACVELKEKGITKIITSPFPRTQESAQIIATELGLGVEDVIIDDRFAERGMATSLQGALWEDAHNLTKDLGDWFTQAYEDGEKLVDVKQRTMGALYDIEKNYENETILVVSHGGTIRAMNMGVAGLGSADASVFYSENKIPDNAQVIELAFTPFPHNDQFEFDPHRPFIDDIILEKDDKEYTRVSEVMDVWFDSGAMPFAQDHYPFENKERVDTVGVPAQYISEAIDQTRGWFYTLHAVGTLLGRGNVYENVVCLGHIMHEDGTKMSKSKGNVVNPWKMIAKYGADVLRMWMFTVNQPGDSKNFDEKTVGELERKFFGMFDNVLKFYEMFADDGVSVNYQNSNNVLDQWILALLDTTTKQITEYLDNYKILEAGRALRDFVPELSQWYVRRSRDRFKGDNQTDREYALATLRHVLKTFSLLMAPFAPFHAEDYWQILRGDDDPVSVHLAVFPQAQEVDPSGMDVMKQTRDLVSTALELRAQAKIKVRQPLAKLFAPISQLDNQYIEIIKDEVNVKEVVDGELLLDTDITPDLAHEGDARELIRTIQKYRKEMGMQPDDELTLRVVADQYAQGVWELFYDDIKATANVVEYTFVDSLDEGQEVKMREGGLMFIK